MRKTYVQIDGQLYEKGTEPRKEGTMVMPEIQPYQSMITGEMIYSREQHRQHLRKHGCQEIGNEVAALLKPRGIPDVAPQQRREILRAQMDSMRHDDFKKMVKRDLDRIRWETRNKEN